ncbi:HlyD family efflux transporter periplasmic adaptor subunit [Actinoplanes sp. NPDC089786]|uniref:efflux RND transporter periplasmic adaptor subunit n=1 Tax=Actinoplanes sp. NPDC089786 TaxID=3155185 RepID=UPI0034264DBE
MRLGRWIPWAVAGLVVLAGAAFGVRALLAGDAEPAAAPATATADRGAVTAQVATTGTVQPAQTRSLSFTAAGTVESVKVSAGTVVTAGQVLASIGDDSAAEAVDTARDNVDSAEDALTAARAAATKSAATTACDVAAAAPAPTSASPSSSPRPSASASTRPTSGGATQQPRPSATTPAPTCGTQRTSQGGGTQGGDQIFSAQQRLHQAEKTLADAEDALDGTTIAAPMAGRVLSVAGRVGSGVRAGSPFISLAGATMEISADFPEADAGRLAVKQRATVTLAGPSEEAAATVVQVDPVGTDDGTMVRYGVVLAFEKAPADLLIGRRAALRVTTGSADDALRVPSTAVHDVAGDRGTVLRGGARVAVGVGLRGDAYTEITSGLTEGDVVSRSW